MQNNQLQEQPTIMLESYQKPQQHLDTSFADVDTTVLPSATVMSVAPPIYSRRGSKLLPGFLRRVVDTTLTRSTYPYPEELYTSLKTARVAVLSQPQVLGLGWLPILMVINAVGLFIVAYAYNISRFTSTVTLANLSLVEAVFLFGVLLMFAPIVVRLFSPAPLRFERIGLLCVAGLCLYFVQVTNSPLHFSGFDEFLHWRTTSDIARTGHFYSENVQLPVSTYYLGLDVVTNAISSMSGVSLFHSGLLVLGMARLLIMLSLFLLFEQVTRSSRIASIATAIYMVNPHFIGFDAEYSYESLALPIASFMLFIMSRLDTLPYKHRLMTLVACFVLCAVALSHHVTSYVFDIFLLTWAVTYRFQRPVHLHSWKLSLTALFGVAVAIAVAFIPGNPVTSYLSSYFGSSIADLVKVFVGSNQARPLFVDYTGLPSPLWNRLLMAASVGIILIYLPFGFLSIVQRHRFNGLALMFAIAVLAYPLSQVFRFTSVGQEIADRSAAFLFIPIAYVLAVSMTQFWPTRFLNWKNITLITTALSLVFVGGILLQAGPGLSFLPGPYLVSADNRSVEPESINAALWMYSNIGPNNRIATDRVNDLLMTTYGDQYALIHLSDNVDLSPVFFDPKFGAKEAQLIQSVHIQYLVVDLRMSTAVPLEGIYYDSVEQGATQHIHPIPRSDLTKFNNAQQLNRVFDSGNVVIYDARELVDVP